MKALYTLSEFREKNVRRSRNAFGHDLADWTPLEWGGAAAGEVGEALNLAKKLRRGDRVATTDIADEIADAVTYLDLFAASLGIDLEHAIASKFNRVSQKRGSPESLCEDYYDLLRRGES